MWEKGAWLGFGCKQGGSPIAAVGGSGHGASSLSREAQTSLSPATLSSSSWGIPEAEKCDGENNRKFNLYLMVKTMVKMMEKTMVKKMMVKMMLGTIKSESRLKHLLMRLPSYCPESMNELWTCVNSTLPGVSRRSDGWVGLGCCELAISAECRRECKQAASKNDITKICKKDAEKPLYSCITKNEMGSTCCSYAGRHTTCREYCQAIFRTDSSPTVSQINAVKEYCQSHSAQLIGCVGNYTKSYPIRSPIDSLYCCDRAEDSHCQVACRRILRTMSTEHEIMEGLIEECHSQPLPQDPLWQCFLGSAQPPTKPHEEPLLPAKMDRAKLHCCFKANTSLCRDMCQKVSTNWGSQTWQEFDQLCEYNHVETELIACLADVREPCQLGCKGLSYCTNFNNRPTELFRSCSVQSDQGAMNDIKLWSNGTIKMPFMNIPVLDIRKCQPEMWKAVACALQIKPCHSKSRGSVICNRGQQRTVSTIHSVDDALLPPPETPDGGPEPLRSRPEVVLHGLTELLPCPGFCLGNRHSCAPLGLPVPASCLRSPTGQKCPIGLLLQFDGIPHRRCPPAGSGIAATAGTDHLAATALVGRLNNGGVEHGPLGLNVPRLPRYMVKALPEVGVEALSDRRLCQTFPADPHDTFGSARSDRHSPPPSQPTHHQVVINCVDILTQCGDQKRFHEGQTPERICDLLSPVDDPERCIPLHRYLNNSASDEVIHPCNPNPCPSNHLCQVNRKGCHDDFNCQPYFCVPGCKLGDASDFLVQMDTRIQVPTLSGPAGCYEVCMCGASGRLEDCLDMPCVDTSKACVVRGQRKSHGTSFSVDCQRCSCFAGETICSTRQCSDEHQRFTGLPCDCPDRFVPVCATNGRTYPSACVARCMGFKDHQFVYGHCRHSDPCSTKPCQRNQRCVSKRRVCLSNASEYPCRQYECVGRPVGCDKSQLDPMCDTDGVVHANLCQLHQSGKTLAYVGQCQDACRKSQPVCGQNSETYNTVCEAFSDRVAVDYEGPCHAVGAVSDYAVDSGCDLVVCPLPSNPGCVPVTPPGACCPICASILQILWNRDQMNVFAKLNRDQPVTVQDILQILRLHVSVPHCDVFGYLSINHELVVVITPLELQPTPLQVEACSKEAEKIDLLINYGSPTLVSHVPLSAFLTSETRVPVLHSSGGPTSPLPSLLSVLILLLGLIFPSITM
ncbi:Reversion-inducing cysteine-rich protein with Kazal motifs [Merluccius polli]|uniref:Reversion-inducing cysteine-rich protein with Kazal motifs n=1 Tax=Merluccius polli TaxID=89951 RepID=A0AA47MLJ3_MERPO|nr:Reversion-inducing cysteine-rich protein with Kazal motifs [Merluccius polli]